MDMPPNRKLFMFAYHTLDMKDVLLTALNKAAWSSRDLGLFFVVGWLYFWVINPEAFMKVFLSLAAGLIVSMKLLGWKNAQ
jgi:zinc transporter ZupT